MAAILRLFPNRQQNVEALKHGSHIDLDFTFLKN